MIRIRLEGGPAELPDRERTVEALIDHLRVPFGAGYEHFAFAGEEQPPTSARTVAVYRWTYQTRIAE